MPRNHFFKFVQILLKRSQRMIYRNSEQLFFIVIRRLKLYWNQFMLYHYFDQKSNLVVHRIKEKVFDSHWECVLFSEEISSQIYFSFIEKIHCHFRKFVECSLMNTNHQGIPSKSLYSNEIIAVFISDSSAGRIANTMTQFRIWTKFEASLN